MYTVEPYPEVEDAVATLPEAARVSYEDAVKVMGLMPWNGTPYVGSKGRCGPWCLGPTATASSPT